MSFFQVLLMGSVLMSGRLAYADECGQKFSILDSEIRDYASLLKAGDNKGAERIFDQIERNLGDQNGEKDPCTQALLERYVLDSFNLYQPNLGSKDVSWASDPAAASHPYRLWFEFILRGHHITFLTRKTRQRLGGAWIAQISGSHFEHLVVSDYLTLGAYDCKETRIYLDPELRPFDLLTTIFHEMDHLVRDKLATPTDPEEKDWRLRILLDEGQAIATSSVIYMQSQNWPNRKKIHEDFSLFSERGPVASFYRQRGLGSNEDVAAAELFGKSEVASFFRNQYYSTLWGAYFPGDEIALPNALDFDHYFDLKSSPPGFNSEGYWILEKNIWHYKASPLDYEPSESCKARIQEQTPSRISHYLGDRLSDDASVLPCFNLKREL